MLLPSLERAAHWAELIGGISGTLASLGVFALIRKMRRLGIAVIHVPDMLHEHTEEKGALSKEGVKHPFREQAKAAD